MAIGLARAGITPNVVTIAGTVGILAVCLLVVPRGHIFLALWLILLCAFADLIDGVLARYTGLTSKWGAFLDSVCDRVADGAIFGSSAYYFATQHQYSLSAAAVCCLVTGGVVPYAKAKAESLGLRCDLGVAGRAERLIVIGVGGLFYAADIPIALEIGLWALSALAVFTIGQRCYTVWRQVKDQQAKQSPG
jgi:CDP-diacylglycerol--glycerol-3-phosphate 3-phosphatidyltransferase